MCVSASASFAVSGGLLVAGLAIQQYRDVSNHQQLYALVPFIFSAHQFSEGLVWLGVIGVAPESIQHMAMYFFAFIAYSVWPVYIPVAMYQYERNSIRRLMLPALVLGIGVGGYLLWAMIGYSQLTLQVDCNQQGCGALAYRHELPYLQDTIRYFYLLAIVTPLFLTRNPKIRWMLAPVFLASFPIGAYLTNVYSFASVWCFIAALVSGCIFFTFKSRQVKT